MSQQPPYGQEPSGQLPYQPQPPYGQQPASQPQGNPPMYPPPQMQPPRRRSRRGLWIALGIIVLVLIVCAVSASQLGKSVQTGPTTQVTQPAQSQATQPAATTQPTHALTWTTVQTFKGNGNKKTAVFTVPDDWKIAWSCDPKSFDNTQYNLIVGVYGNDGTPVDAAAINTLCKPGNTSDSTEEHQGGSIYLDIESEAAWTIQVQELK